MNLQKINGWEKNLIIGKNSIRDSLKKINILKKKTLFVINSYKKKQLIGTITEGDIRRALINGFNLNDKISIITNKSYLGIFKKDDIYKNVNKIKQYSISLIPQLNKQKKIVQIYSLDLNKIDKVFSEKIENPILILAGGKGKRLGDLTKKTPKPLILIKRLSIIERILFQIFIQKYRNIFISLHYKASQFKDKLKSYIKENNVKLIIEKKPLGTVGSIKKIDNPNKLPIVVLNSDIVFNFDLKRIINFHNRTKSKMTIVGSNYYNQNPYGVLKIDKKGKLIKIIEKPIEKTQVAGGISVINSELLRLIKSNQKTDMDVFINKILDKNYKVSVYSYDHYWYDLGTKSKLNKFKKMLK